MADIISFDHVLKLQGNWSLFECVSNCLYSNHLGQFSTCATSNEINFIENNANTCFIEAIDKYRLIDSHDYAQVTVNK